MEQVTSVQPGDAVIFVDSVGRNQAALVTNVFGEFYDTPGWTQEQADAAALRLMPDDRGYDDQKRAEFAGKLVDMPHTWPSINVVYVESDEAKNDPYGRQIARATSVCHRLAQPAHGMYWRNI